VPDRMLREGLKMSPKVNALSDRAVDDGGVYYSDPVLIKAAVWPLKSYRVADVDRALDEIERAGLIARWTAKDGSRFLCLLRFRQKLKFPRRRFPKPPFDDESGEMELLQYDDAPQPEAPPPPAPKEKKRREEKGGERETPPPPPPESLESFFVRLRARFPGIDIDAEFAKAKRKKAKTCEDVERGWFEKSWLSNCTPVITTADARTAKAAPVIDADEPEGWREIVSETKYGPGGIFEAKTWVELPADAKKWVRNELQNTATA
jgi:hypothetical protein